MKLKPIHLELLKNFTLHNPMFYYDGNFEMKVRRTDGTVFIEAYSPDFLDIPFSFYDMPSLLKFMDEDTDVSFTDKYICLKKENSILRHRISSDSLTSSSKNNFNFDDVVITNRSLLFNLNNTIYNELIKVSQAINADVLKIYSLDNHTIILKTYVDNKENVSNYKVEIKVEHEHSDFMFIFDLNSFKLIKASDYNIEIGHRTNQNGNIIALMKIKAFCQSNLEVKYIYIARKSESGVTDE